MSELPHEIHATNANFPQLLTQSFTTPIVFQFWAESCEPCKKMSPILSALAKQYDGRFILVKINTDQETQIAQQFGVENLPAMVLFHAGKVISESAAALSKVQIEAFLETHLEPPEDERVIQAQQLSDDGYPEKAIALLERVVSTKPKTVKPYIMLAYMQIKTSDIIAAQSTLESVPKSIANNPEVLSLSGRLMFTSSLIGAPKIDELQQRIVDNENDSEAHYFLASYAVVNANYERALDTLLSLVEKDPEFREQAPRKTMLTIFGMLGKDPLATEYQQKLASLLH